MRNFPNMTHHSCENSTTIDATLSTYDRQPCAKGVGAPAIHARIDPPLMRSIINRVSFIVTICKTVIYTVLGMHQTHHQCEEMELQPAVMRQFLGQTRHLCD
jgi:hypothetical protein